MPDLCVWPGLRNVDQFCGRFCGLILWTDNVDRFCGLMLWTNSPVQDGVGNDGTTLASLEVGLGAGAPGDDPNPAEKLACSSASDSAASRPSCGRLLPTGEVLLWCWRFGGLAGALM